MAAPSLVIALPGVQGTGVLALGLIIILGIRWFYDRQVIYKYVYPAVGAGFLLVGLVILDEQLGSVSLAGMLALAYGLGYRRRMIERPHQ